jgi:ectoine hydroxylase-related dioxygenase (phytanoyl-CoA dioxygenase family)
MEGLDECGFQIVWHLMSDEEIVRMTERVAWQMVSAGLRQPHSSIPEVAAFAGSEAVRNLVEPVLGKRAWLVRSIWFDKNPQNNWGVPWHQDLTIAVRERLDAPGFVGWSVKNGITHVQAPREVLEKMLTVRVHLDECGAENGPLLILPGTHRDGWLSADQIDEFKARTPAVTCVVPRGGAALMRPLLLHSSARAKAPSHRRVLHLEFSGGPLPHGLEWAGRSSGEP